MRRKLKFESQEFISIIVESISSAYLAASGISVEYAELIGESLGGAIRGVSLSDTNNTDKILFSLEKSLKTVLDSNAYELPDACRDILEKDILSPKKIISFMTRPNSEIVLKEKIIQLCEREPECDISTLPVDEIVSIIIEKFEAEILENHELASYASYCIFRRLTSSSGVYMANQQYADSFSEPLFLHKNIENFSVNLKNLFVLPNYQFLKVKRQKSH